MIRLIPSLFLSRPLNRLNWSLCRKLVVKHEPQLFVIANAGVRKLPPSLQNYLMAVSIAVFTLIVSPLASAGNISFQLSLTGSNLTLTEQGDSSAFFPKVFCLLQDGRWQQLSLTSPTAPPVELTSGTHLDFIYPEQWQTAFSGMQATMVRFYDAAGVGFGQISFFHQPSLANDTLHAVYSEGKLIITPPASGPIRSSWLLWPQQDGIAQIRVPQKYMSAQPVALHFVWHTGMESPRIDTGAGQPAAMLLHETASGFFFQPIAGGLQVNEQRCFWLNQSRYFYELALILAGFALLIFMFYFVRKFKIKK